MITQRTLRSAFGVCLLLALPATSQATVTLPFGDLFLNGTLDFRYATDGSARIDPVLYVDSNENFGAGALASVFAPPDTVAAATGLEYGYSFSGAGSGALDIAYTIGNQTGIAWTGLRFFVDVSGDTFDDLLELPTIETGPGDAGDATGWGVDDFISGDLFLTDILSSAELDGENHCAGIACMAEGGLQWNLDTLPDGQTWLIRVRLSDDGSALGKVALRMQLADAVGAALDGQQLSVSGQAVVVPLPGGLMLLLGALPLLAAGGRRSPVPLRAR